MVGWKSKRITPLSGRVDANMKVSRQRKKFIITWREGEARVQGRDFSAIGRVFLSTEESINPHQNDQG
jgi:hypothetical protein